MLKRCTDVAVSAMVLVVFSPIVALVALAVWLDSGSPVFFRQERVGLRFRRFPILKFRTMRGASGPSVTAAGDARITRAGRFLRLTKLDEIPQFYNVLCGHMSLVGPRPEVPEYVEQQRERYTRILQVRPGVTDLASIRFRNEEQILARSGDPQRYYAEVVLPTKLDLAEEYIGRRCFRLDLEILIRTLVVTFTGA